MTKATIRQHESACRNVVRDELAASKETFDDDGVVITDVCIRGQYPHSAAVVTWDDIGQKVTKELLFELWEDGQPCSLNELADGAAIVVMES